jgi:hypothetical protein
MAKNKAETSIEVSALSSFQAQRAGEANHLSVGEISTDLLLGES